jgi:flavin reductase (DIM6/NTAB) family NADH-FMN oxidoreductase RutF
VIKMEMKKEKIKSNFFIPMPVVLAGAQVNGKANFMTVGWCTRVNAAPPMIACAIGNNHYTPKGIAETKTFSVNIPSTSMIEKTDYCGIVSGASADKSGVFEIFYGELETAPMISECPVSLECRLVQTVPLATNSIYIGEIIGAYADGRVIKNGKSDFNEIDPLILTMTDNSYWSLGDHMGDAWSAGKKLKERG